MTSDNNKHPNRTVGKADQAATLDAVETAETNIQEEPKLKLRTPVLHYAVDACIFALAIPVATWVRFDFNIKQITLGLIPAIILVVLLQGVWGMLFGQYRRRWRYGTFDEVRSIGVTALVVGVIASVALWWNLAVPRSVPMIAATMSLLGQVAARTMWRSFNEARRRPGDAADPIIVVGAGDAAASIVRTLLAEPESPYVPVALLDDDPNKAQLRLSRVPVVGKTTDLGTVAKRYQATTVLIAVPSARRSFLRRIDVDAREHGLDVLVLPKVGDMLGAGGLRDIRPITHEDLLGRPPAAIDPVAISSYITGKRVLVTGAGGSIGSELCRQLVQFSPAELFMVDRDENGLHSTQLSIEGQAMLENPSLMLLDIRDKARVDEVFAATTPEIVFHAAALKHLPLLEAHPVEGWKTNVRGTLNLLRAAERCGTATFVNVSTDKAANPTSVLGWTKRVTERLTASANSWGNMRSLSVRFGNVLGSNGSVLRVFQAQAAAGAPLTVTHPDITRYFMTIEEAARLTIQAGAIGEPGEVMILDMGEPVRIVDVARRFAELHDPPLEVVFTGLRHNEKMHEDLVSDTEVGERKAHHMITHVQVPPMSDPTLCDAVLSDPDEMAQLALSSADPTISAER